MEILCKYRCNEMQRTVIQKKNIFFRCISFGYWILDMIIEAFSTYGILCASHPWETILATLAGIGVLLSYTFSRIELKLCGWNFICEDTTKDQLSSDIIIMTLVRSIAVLCVYMQVSKLRRYGSKYLLVLAALLATFSTFIFSAAVVFLLHGDLQGLGEAWPFFLLLVDLEKPRNLAKYAFAGEPQDEVIANIGRGMSVIGPVITLDMAVETLSVGVGLMSGVRILETMCTFGCISLLVNWLAFMTFYPACIALICDVSRNVNRSHLKKLAELVGDEEGDFRPNPLSVRLKMIMSVALVVVHGQSRLFGERAEIVTDALGQRISPELSLWNFYFTRQSYMTVDYILPGLLVLALIVKFFVIDGRRQGYGSNSDGDSSDEEINNDQQTKINGRLTTNEMENAHNLVSRCDSNDSSHTITDVMHSQPTSQIKTEPKTKTPAEGDNAVSFRLGDESSEDSGSEQTTDTCESSTQTEPADTQTTADTPTTDVLDLRSLDQCETILAEKGASYLSDAELVMLVKAKKVRGHQLEKTVGDHERGVCVRRKFVEDSIDKQGILGKLPFQNYEYKYVDGACCENVVGYVPVPVGFAGPLLLDGERYQVPMATTEGCLLASTNRGCQALSAGGGVRSVPHDVGMSRAPCLRFSSVQRAAEARLWVEDADNLALLEEAFNSTSRFARLRCIRASHVVGRLLYLRVSATTGDAMGMNMIGKGTQKLLLTLKEYFDDMTIVSLSGNYCTDKKPAAINWIEGRGKSVCCEAVIPAAALRSICKTDAKSLVDLNISKNLIGSAMAGSVGGNNAHAANIVAAMFLATGQDIAQTVESANCLTYMEIDGVEDLYMSCTMPSLEVGTVGGGTILPAQGACLDLLGVRGASADHPGANACRLASIICATVMAGELSLMSALSTNDLIKSHLRHNRSTLIFDKKALEAAQSRLEASKK